MVKVSSESSRARRAPWRAGSGACLLLTAALWACTSPETPPPQTVTPDEALEEQATLAAEENAQDLTPIVILDGATILHRGALEDRLDSLSHRFESTSGRSAVSAQWRDERRRYLINTAVDDALLRAFVMEHYTLPTNDETLAHLRASNPNVFGNDEIFDRYLAGRHITRADYLASEAVEIALQEAYRQRGMTEPTDDELQDFFSGQQERMRAKERILLSSITLPIDDPNTERQIARHTQTLRRAREEILASRATFAEVSERIGAGPERARQGNLGWIQRGEDRLLRLARIEDTLFSAPAGTISEPVLTSGGVQIYWVRDRRPAGTRQLDEVREALSQPLMHRKRREFRQALLRELRENALIEINAHEVRWEIPSEVPPLESAPLPAAAAEPDDETSSEASELPTDDETQASSTDE